MDATATECRDVARKGALLIDSIELPIKAPKGPSLGSWHPEQLNQELKKHRTRSKCTELAP
jgi:hypothetical protein